jgi:hypothetical protein
MIPGMIFLLFSSPEKMIYDNHFEPIEAKHWKDIEEQKRYVAFFSISTQWPLRCRNKFH